LWKFNVIYFLHTSFWYFSDKDNEIILENISYCLKKNGLFLLDLNNPYDNKLFVEWESILKKWDDYIKDIKKVLNNKLFIDRIIKKWNIYIKERYTLRIYKDIELEKIWNKYNLKLLKIFWDFKWNIFNKNSKRMILLFKKY